MVIPVLPEVVLTYCLPGILYWIMMDARAGYEPVEQLLTFTLPRFYSGQREAGFAVEQKRVIMQALILIRDLFVDNDLKLVRAVNDILLGLDVDRVN
jgi:hypothetical protein